MTIEKFEGWGSPTSLEGDLWIAPDDASLAAAAWQAASDGQTLQAGVASGEMLRTIGLDEPRSGSERYEYPIDLVAAYPVLADGSTGDPHPFVAHLVAGAALSPRWGCVAVNTPWLRRWRLGPRAHPNDGLVDITTGAVPLMEIPEARRRATTGSHLPHPGLTHKRVKAFDADFPRPLTVEADGVRLGRWLGLRLTVLPDAMVLVV